MSCFASIVLCFIALCATVFAAPVLEKRTTHRGKATWFEVGEGACGKWNTDNDMIVALSFDIYGNPDKESQYCGRYVHVTNEETHKSVYAVVRDACKACDKYQLDMSPKAFNALGGDKDEHQHISWNFEKKGWAP